MAQKLGTGSGRAVSKGLLGRRVLALASVTALGFSCLPARAAESVGNGVYPTYDEAYYATLDYYGNLTNGSVVKSYALNGATSITDYGTYDQVTNLTDGTEPSSSGGTTTFDFGASAPDDFYFEGSTSAPYTSLPWTITMSYKLNGVPTKAEDLAGKTGVVDINLDIVPNANASDYAKNNYTLEAMALFNQDDILSLKAEGAQVQLLGNLRMVLFLALPGEEQHFTIEVGTNSFTFDGMTYLMVPATLSQLDQIADLKKNKQDIEDDYDKLNGSLDTFLNSLDAMTGSLRSTASGLDELNEARGIISSGKGDVYGKADTALGDLDNLSDSLGKIPAHLDTASQAVTEVSDDLTTLTKATVGLKDDLSSVRENLDDVQKDLTYVRNDLTGKSGDNLQKHLETLGTDADHLKTSVKALETALSADNVQLNGQSLSAVKSETDGLNSAYAASGAGKSMTFQQFLLAAAIVNAAQSGSPMSAADVKQMQDMMATSAAIAQLAADNNLDAATAEGLYFQGVQQKTGYSDAEIKALKDAYDAGVAQLGAKETALAPVYQIVAGSTDKSISKVQFYELMLMLSDINSGAATAAAAAAKEDTYASTAATLQNLSDNYGIFTASSDLLDDMGSLCDILGSDGVSGDLSGLTGLAGDTLGDLDDLSDSADSVLSQTETILDQVQKLDDTVNKYVPDLQSTLSDTKDMVSNLNTTVTDTHGFLSSFESLLKKSGTKLDSGAQKSLTGLASTLRKAADSIDTTDSIRTAKNNIDDIITDEWDDHTGDVDNLLNMDNTAPAVSLTSVKNGTPQSVQILIRSEEIKVPDEDTAEKKASETDTGTFWSRVVNLCKHIGSAITGLFQQ